MVFSVPGLGLNPESKTSPNDLFKHVRKRQTQTLKQKSCLKLCRGSSNLKVCRTSANHFRKPPNPWRWRWGAAFSMPRVSDIDDACGISAHHMFLSNCVVQVMRVWSLPAFLLPLAKQHIRYGVTQRTAYRISNGVCGGRGIRYHALISGCLSSCAGRS